MYSPILFVVYGLHPVMLKSLLRFTDMTQEAIWGTREPYEFLRIERKSVVCKTSI